MWNITPSGRLCLIALNLIAAFQLFDNTLFAQRARFGIRRATGNGALPAGVTVHERTDAPPKSPDDGRPVSFRGIVRDALGRPVDKATVWLISRRTLSREETTFDASVETITDAAGRFSFGEVDEKKFFGTASNWIIVSNTTVVARDSKGRIGWHEVRRHSHVNRACEIRLREPTELTGRVLDGEGRPLAGARLTPIEFLAHPPGEKRVLSDYFFLHPTFAAGLSTVTAADGRYHMAGVPSCDLIQCQLAARGVDKARVYLEVGDDAMIRVGKPGGIAGSLAVPDDPNVTLAGLRLSISMQPVRERLPWRPLDFDKTTTVNDRGAFHFDGLPPGRYRIGIDRNQNVPYLAGMTTDVEVEQEQQVSGLTLPLTKLRQVSGRAVERGTEKPIPGVELVGFNDSSTNGAHVRQLVKTGADGRFSVWLPTGRIRIFEVGVPAEYLTSPNGDNNLREAHDGQWPDTELEPAAVIEGRVVDEAGNPVPFASLAIDRAWSGGRSESWQPNRCDHDGKFKIEQLPRDELVALRARTSTSATRSALTVTPAQVDRPVELVISEGGACWIRGRVTSANGIAVPTATVAVVETRHTPSSRGGSSTYYESIAYLALEPDGSFESEALWPGANYHLRISAAGYADYEGPTINGEPGKIYDLGRLAIEPFMLVAGEVIHADGHFVRDAELYVDLPPGSPGRSTVPEQLHTDESGWFVLPRVKGDGPLRIWARKDAATTGGVQAFDAKQVKTKLRLAIAEQNARHARGKVVDLRGEPVPAAKVATFWESEIELPGRRASWLRFKSYRDRYARRRSSGGPAPDVTLGEVQTGHDGTFILGSLWPDEHYHLVVTAEGRETVELPAILAASGEDAPPHAIVLRRGGLAVEGMVIDQAGNGVPDAMVINSGDAPRMLRVPTDANGHFRLDGLYEGPSYLLIQKEGYRPGGLRARAGQTDLRVTLIDAGQPRPDTRSASPADGLSGKAIVGRPSRPSDATEGMEGRPTEALRPNSGFRAASEGSLAGEEQAVARRLLEELWAFEGQIPKGRNSASLARLGANRFPTPLDFNLAALMVRIDPQMALGWATGKTERFAAQVRTEIIRAGKAGEIGLAVPPVEVGPAFSPNELAGLPEMVAEARRDLANGDREEAIKRLKTAWRLVEQNRETLAESRGDVIWAAKTGALAIAAGAEAWGRQLVNEAADRVEKPDGDGPPLATLGEVVIALAKIDRDRAMRIWKALPPPPSKDRAIFAQYATRLAIVLASHDTEAARRVAASQEYLEPDLVMIEVACRLGSTHPDRAIQIVEELRNEWQQAGAFERLAVSIAKRDPARGFDLIDRALAICGPRSARQSRLDLSDVAGPLALTALEIGYPDLASVVDRVLAARLAADDRSTEPGRAASIVNFARLLALIDPKVARELLNVVPRPADSIDTAAGDETMAKWLQAWSLIDLARAERLFKDVLAEQRSRLTSECVQSCLLPMIDLLTTPRAGRAALLAVEHNERYRAFPFNFPDD